MRKSKLRPYYNPYYKKYLTYPEHRSKDSSAWLGQKVDASEGQICLAIETDDYWPARARQRDAPPLPGPYPAARIISEPDPGSSRAQHIRQ